MSPNALPSDLTLGVVGAGTMGSGIALAGLYADIPVILYDIQSDVLQSARDYIQSYLERKALTARQRKLSLTSTLDDLSPAGFIVEAAPERLELKQDLFSRLDSLLPPPTVLATNTSTLSVTEIASGAASPQRVVGMHFFNPAAVMPLVEVVRAARTDQTTVDHTMQLARLLGKTPVEVRDMPGFIVNRVARPFYGEALRLLEVGGGSVGQIDALVRSAGFKMGPFELMDLIGIDVNLAAASSVYERTFQEPRFRPHPIQRAMVQAGDLGVKTGRGFYRYDSQDQQSDRLDLPPPDRDASGKIWVVGSFWDAGVRNGLEAAGFELTEGPEGTQAAFLLEPHGSSLGEALEKIDRQLKAERPLFCQVNDVSWSELAGLVAQPERLVGFDALFFNVAAGIQAVGEAEAPEELRDAASGILQAAGRWPFWLPERPGTVLGRIVGSIVNEAAFALEEGLAPADTIDKAMRLGANYPTGPLKWGRQLGWERLVPALDHLWTETKEPRYRVAPALRRWSRRPPNTA